MFNKKILMAVVCYSLALYGSPSPAAPDGAALLAACKHSLQHDFQGIQGRMCHWYVTPCDCHHGKQPAPPRVCLPPSIPVETLAEKVIKGLLERPELQAETAEMAAAIILEEHYPCPEGD